MARERAIHQCSGRVVCVIGRCSIVVADPAAAKLYRRDRLAPADAQKAAMSAGCVSKLRSPTGSVIQGCLLRVHRCTVGRNHDVSSSVPARTVRTGAPGLGVPLIHEPQSGQSQRIVTRPLSVVRSTGRARQR